VNSDGGSGLRDNWKETTATVWSVMPRVAGVAGSTGTVVISYEVSGEQHSSELCTNRAFVKGEKFQLRYDPKNPDRNELSVRSRRWKLVCIALLSLLAAFAICMYVHPTARK
jgi:Protein of unknown function (DUF3592)